MTFPQRLPRELEDRLSAELESGERLLWSGQPRPARLGRQAMPQFLMGIPFTAFAIFWISMAGMGIWGAHPAKPGSGPVGLFYLFPLFGVPFVLAGLGMLASPLFAASKAGKTVYAVTDRRAIFISPGTFGAMNIRSLPPNDLEGRTRTQSSDGSGDIVFPRAASLAVTSWGNQGNPWAGQRGRYSVNEVGFFGIPDARFVDTLIRETFESKDRPIREN